MDHFVYGYRIAKFTQFSTIQAFTVLWRFQNLDAVNIHNYDTVLSTVDFTLNYKAVLSTANYIKPCQKVYNFSFIPVEICSKLSTLP